MKKIKDILIKYPSIIIVAIMFVIAAFIVVFGKNSTTISSHNIEKTHSEIISTENPATGVFVPYDSFIKEFGFIPNRDSSVYPGTLNLIIVDEYGSVVADVTKNLDELEYGYINSFPLSVKLNKGCEYTYCITPDGYGDMPVSVDVGTLSCGTGEIRSFCIGDKEFSNTILLTENVYLSKLSKKTMLPRLLLILILGILCICALNMHVKWTNNDKFLVYILCVVSGALIILMNDEGAKPLHINGVNLEHTQGYEDYRGFLSADPATATGGLLAWSDEYMLLKGGYSIDISYLSASEENTIEVYNDGHFYQKFNLSPINTYAKFSFDEIYDTQNTVIKIYYCGEGLLKINSIDLEPAGVFYSDNIFFLVIYLILNMLYVVVYFKGYIAKIDTKKLFINFILIGISILSLIPFLRSDLRFADDICYHLLRIEGIKDGILDGQIPVMIYPNALGGNGYLNAAYPYLFLYISAILRLLNVSLALSYKFLIFIATLCTAYATYYCIRTLKGSRLAAILGVVAYILLPYRYTNIFVRGALGELLAMTFIPLIIAGMYHILCGNKDKWYVIFIGMSGLLQSHIISFVIMAIVCVFVSIIFVKDLLKNKHWIELVKAAIFTILANMWFICPFVFYYFKGNLHADSLELSKYSEYTLNISGLLNTINQSDVRYLSLGIIVAILTIYGLYHFFISKNEDLFEAYIRAVFIIGLANIFCLLFYGISNHLMSIELIRKLYYTIQFPWRLLAYGCCMIIIPSVIWICADGVLDKYLKVSTVVFILIIVNVITFIPRPDIEDLHNQAYENYTDTYSSGHITKIKGIMPRETTVRYPYEWRYNGASEDLLYNEMIPTKYETTEIVSYEKRGTVSKVEYIANEDDSKVILPIMGYYGYQAYDETGKNVEYSIVNKNAIQIPLLSDGLNHSVTVKYKMNIWFVISTFVSIITILLLIYTEVYRVKKIKKSNNKN